MSKSVTIPSFSTYGAFLSNRIQSLVESNITIVHWLLVPLPYKAVYPGPSPRQSGPSHAAQIGPQLPMGTAPHTWDTISPLRLPPFRFSPALLRPDSPGFDSENFDSLIQPGVSGPTQLHPCAPISCQMLFDWKYYLCTTS